MWPASPGEVRPTSTALYRYQTMASARNQPRFLPLSRIADVTRHASSITGTLATLSSRRSRSVKHTLYLSTALVRATQGPPPSPMTRTDSMLSVRSISKVEINAHTLSVARTKTHERDGDSNTKSERKSPDSLHHSRQFSLRRPSSTVTGPCGRWLGSWLLSLLSLLVLLLLLLL